MGGRTFCVCGESSDGRRWREYLALGFKATFCLGLEIVFMAAIGCIELDIGSAEGKAKLMELTAVVLGGREGELNEAV